MCVGVCVGVCVKKRGTVRKREILFFLSFHFKHSKNVVKINQMSKIAVALRLHTIIARVG